MSVETKYLVKLMLVKNICLGILDDKLFKGKEATILWMLEEVQTVKQGLLDEEIIPKKRRSLVNVANKKLSNIYTLKTEILDRKDIETLKPGPYPELHTISILLCILEDMNLSKKYRSRVDAMIDAAYLIEAAVKVDHYPTILAAEQFVKEIYKKMEI